MANAYSVHDSNVSKTWALMIGFLIFIIGLGWGISWYFDSPIILIIAVVFAVVMNFTSYWFSDRIVLTLSGAKKASREEYFDLWNATENLSITAGIPMPALYVIHDPVPNAFATGRNEEHSAVAVTTGLLQILNKVELEGVVAHELAHIKNRDILLQSVVVILVGFVTLISDFFLRVGLSGGNNKGGSVRLVGLMIGLVLAILSPIIATIIQLAISRRREFMADAGGALLTRYPEGLASALRKISQYSGQMVRANHATAHLYIANPFGAQASEGGGFLGPLNRLFATHPPTSARIKALIGE